LPEPHGFEPINRQCSLALREVEPLHLITASGVRGLKKSNKLGELHHSMAGSGIPCKAALAQSKIDSTGSVEENPRHPALGADANFRHAYLAPYQEFIVAWRQLDKGLTARMAAKCWWREWGSSRHVLPSTSSAGLFLVANWPGNESNQCSG
jgi:hypothetical protein